jgi:hypothetical protein
MLNVLEKRSSLSLTVLLLALVIGCLAGSRAQAQVPGTGIWMLRGTYHDYSITLVNLTHGQLIIESRDVNADENCVKPNQAQPFVDPNYPGFPVVVDPYQSMVWATYSPNLDGCAHFWDGTITFLAGFTDWGSQWKFDLNFVSDKKSWLYKTGTWAYLTATPGSSWWNNEGWGFTSDSYWPNISHLWTTLYNDGQMRNITLIEPSIYAPQTVSLYSQDNNNIVLVVQETAALQQAANATYKGYKLDWVDNADDNVPEH